MKTHVVIGTLAMVLLGMQLASASDRAFIQPAIDSPQMQNLSKRPYQQLKPTINGTDTALQDAAFREYHRRVQRDLKLHSLAKRNY